MSRARTRSYRVIAALVLALLLGVAGVRRHRPPPAALAEALTLREQTTSSTTPRTPQQRRRQLRRLEEAVGRLSPEERKHFWTDRRRQFRDWLHDFFRAPRQEQIALLNAELDRMDAFRRQGTSSSGGSPGPGWAAGLSPVELMERQKQWLDLTSPEERALVDQYFQMLAQQRQQRGQGGSSPFGNAPT